MRDGVIVHSGASLGQGLAVKSTERKGKNNHHLHGFIFKSPGKYVNEHLSKKGFEEKKQITA